MSPAGATISQVAAAAGVSRATVSRVMNGRATVAPELAERVRAAAAALGYSPSPVARSLALGRTSTVAFVVPDLSNPMFQSVLRGLGQAAAKEGHRLIVAESNEDPAEETLLAVEIRRRVDGIVLAASRLPDDELAELVPRLEPVVLVNREVPGLDVPSLSVDHRAGVRDLAAHLFELGHSRLVYLAGPQASVSDRERLHGLRAAVCDTAGAELVELRCGSGFADGQAAVPAVVACGASGVVAYNDLVAFGALSGLHELGIAVPEQISVVGFDDIPFARYTTPPLTTASVPQFDLGEQAWQRLWALLQDGPPQHNVTYRPRLEVRGSTGPAPGAAGGEVTTSQVADNRGPTVDPSPSAL
ncbi:LacI family DNA-binding transcriptional regulator [Pseudonocardia xinjiangensis]|uniref:LacI family DNA-binding transcriptional regulator n=1 Tax=Pseudonocardia xinjiangensis TaxID=75289 RepID=UPI003D8D12C9